MAFLYSVPAEDMRSFPVPHMKDATRPYHYEFELALLAPYHCHCQGSFYAVDDLF